MTRHPDGMHTQPDIGSMVPVPTRPGLFRTDVHGGSAYITDPVSYHIGPAYRVPVAGYAGSSQALPDAQTTLMQRTGAAQLGLFAVRESPISNYDSTPMPGEPALPVERFSVGQFVPGHPLGLTSDLGHGG